MTTDNAAGKATRRPVMVTGAAGFIGYHLCERLLERGDMVLGVDNLNDYYDVSLKEARLSRLRQHVGFEFQRLDIAETAAMQALFAEHRPRKVVNLAAQAGVRYSLTNPHAYVNSNLVGFANVLEGCRHGDVEHLVYASSSSVYGGNTKLPFSVKDNVDHPLSLYAASKKANELMAHTYSHLYDIPTTGLRFFTVYGPWGRPDMAMFIFTKAILEGSPISVFNYGEMSRDFTYIDDIVDGVVRVLDRPARPDPGWSGDDPDPGTSSAPYRVYNIGNAEPVDLLEMISLIEAELGKKAERALLPMQPGDVPATFADVSNLQRDLGYSPGTPLSVGVKRFVRWYEEFYGVAPVSGD